MTTLKLKNETAIHLKSSATKPTTKPDKPTTKSDKPVTKPVTKPDKPVTKPDKPATKPDKPATKPATKPTAKPTTKPATKPDKPDKPDKPATKPVTKPTTKPDKPDKPNRIRNVLLDLDETLISAIEMDDMKKDKALLQLFKERCKLFRWHKMDNDYIITERPGVQEFLDFVFEHFNVSVWTAASKEYALFVIERVILCKPERKLDYICFSYHCDLSREKTGCIKQLNNQFYHYPQYNPENTVIIDDNHNVLTKQMGGVIPIKPFQFFSKQSDRDHELTKIKCQLCERL